MADEVDDAVSPTVATLLSTYPRPRPPLTPAHEKVYAEQYRINREGGAAMESVAQRLERWMHRRVASLREGPVLELGAGTLNHRRYEDSAIAYDVVEPFRELYAGRIKSAAVRASYDSVADVPAERRYARVISIAVLEHMENLPQDVATAALHLDERGVFQAGIPSEGGFLWGAAWRLSTGVSYYLRTGLNYATLMRHEHLNSAPEIVAILRHLFADVRLTRFPLPLHHASFYTYVEAREPDRARCRSLASTRVKANAA
jgi:hypothetical protein